MKYTLSILFIAVLIWSSGSFLRKDSYIGFYYPDASNLFNNVQSDRSFESLDQCRAWVNEQESVHNPDGTKQDDYECGKNCNLKNAQKPYVCEETLE